MRIPLEARKSLDINMCIYIYTHQCLSFVCAGKYSSRTTIQHIRTYLRTTTCDKPQQEIQSNSSELVAMRRTPSHLPHSRGTLIPTPAHRPSKSHLQETAPARPSAGRSGAAPLLRAQQRPGSKAKSAASESWREVAEMEGSPTMY